MRNRFRANGARLGRDRLRLCGFGSRDAVAREEAAGGEELGVEKRGAGGSAQQVVREQGEFDVEERTFADSANGGGHAVAGVDITAGLRAVFFVEDDDGIFDGGGKSGE